MNEEKDLTKFKRNFKIFFLLILILIITSVSVLATSGSGGTTTTSGEYTIHTFTTDGQFNITGDGTIELLVVGGGAGGGSGSGGGGGAGGLIYNTSYSVTSGQIINITIGAGGINNTAGGNTTFGIHTAIGGGNGGKGGSAGGGGGSGGGAGNSITTYATGTAGQGNNGGIGNGASLYQTGGGGGAGGAGGNPISTTSGLGGLCLYYTINGSNASYSGGGGGGGSTQGSAGGTGGCGTAGNGGSGASQGTNATSYGSGGGGGGGGSTTQGGFGKQGIVILRYTSSTPSYIDFSSQDPSDITTNNLFSSRLNITYNISDDIVRNTNITLYALPYIGTEPKYYGAVDTTIAVGVNYLFVSDVTYSYNNLSSFGCSFTDFRLMEAGEKMYCWNGYEYTMLLNIADTIQVYGAYEYTTLNNSIVLFYNSSVSSYLNGSIYNGNYAKNYASNTTQLYSFLLYDNNVYSGTYNIEESIMESTNHSTNTLSSSNEYWKIELKNVDNNKSFNQFEIYANNSGNAELYYCNSSYLTGNPSVDANCILISTFSKPTFNHTHNLYSKHNLFSVPINTTTGQIGNIKVTSDSYFLLSTITGNLEIGYINNASRNNAFQYSSNNGGSWTSNNTITIDANLHQYNTTDYFSYYACYSNSTTTTTCSTPTTDSYNLTLLPPTSPEIVTPLNQNYPYNASLLINYTASQPYTTGVTITNYNISLLNSDLTFNRTINGTTTALTQTLDPATLTNFSTGEYYIQVEATDSNLLTSYDLSEPFNITSLINIKFKNAYTNDYQTNFTGWIYSGGLNQTFDSGSANNVTLNILPGLVEVYVERANYSITSSNYYNFTLNTTPQILNLTMSIYTSNSIYITIKDESTANLINESILLELQYLNLTIGNYNTSNGIIYLENLTDGEYTLVFSGDLGVNYTSRTYVVSLAEQSTQTLNAYLTSSGNSVIIRTADSFSQAIIEGATISLYKSINNTWTLIEIKNSDITGRAQFSFIPLTQYRFVVQKTNYITKSFELNPILFESYDVLLERQIIYTFTGSQEDVKITWSPQQYYANETTNFTMIFSSATGVLNNYGVNISAPCVSYNFSGNNSIGQTFQQNFNINCSQYRDTINITYFYTSVGNDEKIYHVQYFISGTYSASNYTWINMRNNHFGMGLLERIFIVVLLAVLVGGTAYLMVGGIGALLLSLFIYGYFVATGFIPMWSIVISLISGVFLMLGGKD